LVPELALPPAAGAVLLDRMAFYTGPGEHALGYLVPGPVGELEPGRRRYNWVWYRGLPDADLAALMVRAGKPSFSSSISPRELAPVIRTQLVNAAVRCLPEPFALAVAVEPQPFMRAVFEYVAPRLSRGRVALLGDAAVTSRPHAAMGAAKAAGDALTLADLIARLPVDAALAEYDRLRLPIGRRIAAYGRHLGDSLPLKREYA
jgi:2-polyprenyl-6-methoxyphenol hydroxylase-like FAD-dependent oxidoreductase